MVAPIGQCADSFFSGWAAFVELFLRVKLFELHHILDGHGLVVAAYVFVLDCKYVAPFRRASQRRLGSKLEATFRTF